MASEPNRSLHLGKELGRRFLPYLDQQDLANAWDLNGRTSTQSAGTAAGQASNATIGDTALQILAMPRRPQRSGRPG